MTTYLSMIGGHKIQVKTKNRLICFATWHNMGGLYWTLARSVARFEPSSANSDEDEGDDFDNDEFHDRIDLFVDLTCCFLINDFLRCLLQSEAYVACEQLGVRNMLRFFFHHF